jgi:SAM-dependent methyltransferase
MKVIKDFYPNFPELKIHESSPGGRGVSIVLGKECPGYSYSHYFPDVQPGELGPKKARCENLEGLTFEDSSFDLVITQDVMEHIFDPESAFKEIARILKPGGAHIFTVPIVNKTHPTRRRASLRPDSEIEYYLEPEYHGNPVDPKGSLVTMDWGFDIATTIQDVSGLPTLMIQIEDIDSGIRAEYIEVLISCKIEPHVI